MVGQSVQDLSPEDVAAGIKAGRYLLVDVRETNEVEAEAYPDGVVLPLSTFDPAALPDPQGKEVVFACRSGRRSVTASQASDLRIAMTTLATERAMFSEIDRPMPRLAPVTTATCPVSSNIVCCP